MLSAPLNIHWELTNRCNLRCIHCYQQDDERDAVMPSASLLSIIAHRIADASVFELTLTGGEIMMVKQLPWLLDFFNERGIEPHVTSNGTLVSERRADELAARRLTFQVSIDSADPSVHDGVRQKRGALARAVRGIERLVERGVSVSVAYTCMPQNADSVPGVLELAERIGVHKVCVGEVLPYFGGRSQRTQMTRSTEATTNAHNRLLALVDAYAGRIDLKLAFQGVETDDPVPKRQSCTALDRDLAILHDGSAYPCPFVRKAAYRLGSVVDTPIRELWSCAAAERFRREKTELHVFHCRLEAEPTDSSAGSLLPMLQPANVRSTSVISSAERSLAQDFDASSASS